MNSIFHKVSLTLTLSFVAVASTALGQQQVQTDSQATPPLHQPRFLWYPDKYAVRFGQATDSTVWPSPGGSAIGNYSFAAGLNAKAAGPNTFSFGNNANAHNTCSNTLVFGNNSWVQYGDITALFGNNSSAWTAYRSLIFGNNTSAAANYDSFIFGSNVSMPYFQNHIFLFGQGAYATGDSVAIGRLSNAASIGNISIGQGSGSFGSQATAVGASSEAFAPRATAVGSHSLTTSFGGVALGFNNVSARRDGLSINPGSPHDADPILMVGNATTTGEANRRNALTVYRDGDAHFTGAVRVPQSGDISMGNFTSTPGGVSYP